MAFHLDIPLQRNEDYHAMWQIADQANVPIDITGWTFRFQIRRPLSNAQIVGVAHVVADDPAQGMVDVHIDGGPGSTLASYGDPLQPANLPYDLVAIDPDGDRLALARGDVVLSRGVSI
jgi:hypothetical protein